MDDKKIIQQLRREISNWKSKAERDKKRIAQLIDYNHRKIHLDKAGRGPIQIREKPKVLSEKDIDIRKVVMEILKRCLDGSASHEKIAELCKSVLTS